MEIFAEHLVQPDDHPICRPLLGAFGFVPIRISNQTHVNGGWSRGRSTGSGARPATDAMHLRGGEMTSNEDFKNQELSQSIFKN